MGPWGAIIMSFFGSVFFALAVTPYASSGIYSVPVAIFAGAATGAWRIIRDRPAGATRPGARAERIIRWATIGEGIGIPLVAILLANTGHAGANLCGIALVVGLHFIPMAYAVPFRPFYPLAAALIVAAAIGFVLRQPLGSAVAGVGAAAGLWFASAAALRRSRAA